ncbi:MAG: hypothetical protein K9H64_01115 [Bacteroidales bacterium]|nr:hypothetical protein [Bacteroidales bacterium]MCF8454747.1 hypothetical protein [Bacteroidales bacterium]
MFTKRIFLAAFKIPLLILFIYLIGFGVLSALYVSKIHDFLAITKTVEPQVLLVEGWLDENYIKMAADEINKHGYEKVITTGGNLPEAFRLHTNGGLIYHLNDILHENVKKAITTISLTCYGTPAYNIYPQVKLWADTLLLATFFVEREPKNYSFQLPVTISEVERIIIEFTNDAFDGWKDRNLFVLNLLVDGEGIGVRHKGVYYDRGKLDGKECEQIDASNYADQARKLLIIYGIEESRIVAIPAEAHNSNRTLSHALAVKKQIGRINLPIHSINIFTKGTHARRSYMAYRRVLGDDIHFGVISKPSNTYDPERWWRSRVGTMSVVYESLAYIYYWAVLFFV